MFRRIVALIVCVAFTVGQLQTSFAQGFNVRQLPEPGKMVATAPDFVPLTLKGLVLHPENALKFDFLMDTGHSGLKGQALNDEALKIMTYFLTALTMPEDDMWVNLSPYEQGKVIENNFGRTIMGRDLLAEDYVLKQLTSSLIYPEKKLGQTFWKEVYNKIDPAELKDISVETINKVWIVPSEAVVWEQEGKVMIIKSHLRVMLEEDYLALKNHADRQLPGSRHTMASRIVKSIVLPVLEKQVNEGEHFAQLRQMYQAMILATWYKKALKESIITKVYADKKKIKGVINNQVQDIEAIYKQYLDALKKGAFNYIKEDVDERSGRIIPRKYFSGGFTLKMGIITLGTALLIWSGQPTQAQQPDIDQALRPVGQTVLVEGRAAEADTTGRPILMAQATEQDKSVQTPTSINTLEREEISKLLISGDTNVVVRLGSPAVPVLMEILESGDSRQMRGAAEVLGMIGDSSAAPALIEALKSGDWMTRMNAANALGRIGDVRATPGLRLALSDDVHSVVNAADNALERLGVGLWQRNTDNQQLMLISFLGVLGLMFFWALKDELSGLVWNVRRKKITVMLGLGTNIEKIIKYLNDEDSFIRAVARKNLERLVTDTVAQYELGMQQLAAEYTGRYEGGDLRDFTDNKLWALKMVARSKQDDSFRTVIKWFTNNFDEIKDRNAIGNEYWNDLMLELEKAGKGEVFVLNEELMRAENAKSYYLYNVLSGILHKIDPNEGNYSYGWVVTSEALNNFEDVVAPYGSDPYVHQRIVVGVTTEEGYWEKVELSTGKTVELFEHDAASRPETLGGIALDSNLLKFEVRKDGVGVPLPVSWQLLDNINIHGFVPQIINIKTVNMIDYLGLNHEQPAEILVKI